jgi:hypothetical protein
MIVVVVLQRRLVADIPINNHAEEGGHHHDHPRCSLGQKRVAPRRDVNERILTVTTATTQQKCVACCYCFNKLQTPSIVRD